MSAAADTLGLPGASDRVVGDDARSPSTESSVAARLVDGDPEPFPYTKVRDWIALLSQADLSDGAFRLYYISRSVIWENMKGGAPPKPVVEITYEEYAQIMGRSARTISRFAEDLLKVGIWEELERASRSVRVPGKPRPQVQTVLTIRVHDYPREPWSFAGPTKTWDVLGALREAKRLARETSVAGASGVVSAGGCVRTDLSAQSDQGDEVEATPEMAPASAGVCAGDGVRAGQCDRTDLSAQSEQGADPSLRRDDGDQDHPQVGLPAETDERAGWTAPTDLSLARTDLSEADGVSAGHSARDGAFKKKGEEENKPSLPPTPSPQQHETLADELAMFSAATVELVGLLYDKTVTTPGLPPLSAADRAGLARRIEGRLAEGWAVSRVRAVLTGGSLVGVKMPGRLWAGRLDDMPTYRATRGRGDSDAGHSVATDRRGDSRRGPAVVTNDCSTMPDPNAGKARYEVPDGRGARMTVRWVDTREVSPWCGRCSSDTRCLRPNEPGSLLRPCPECHPEPQAFPVELGEPTDSDAHEATTALDEPHAGHQPRNGQPTGLAPSSGSRGTQRRLSAPVTEGH